MRSPDPRPARTRTCLRTRAAAAVVALALTLAACSGDDAPTPGGGDGPAEASADRLLEVVGDEVARQEDAGTPLTPLGRATEGCLVVDEAAIAAIADAMGITEEGTVLSAVIREPDADPVVQCAISFGEASAGAVVVAVQATEGDVGAAIAELEAAGFEARDVDDAPSGLDPDRVLLLDSTQFQAGRAVWVGEEVRVSLTANADLADAGALLDALPIAVGEVTRTLG